MCITSGWNNLCFSISALFRSHTMLRTIGDYADNQFQMASLNSYTFAAALRLNLFTTIHG